MGCWNETDMLSQLPIHEGETVHAVILALRRNWTTRRSSLPNEEWTPVSPLLLGQYDGYGGIREIVGGDELAKRYTRLASDGITSFSNDNAGNTTMCPIQSIEDLVGLMAEPHAFVTLSSVWGFEPEQTQLAFIRTEICAYAMAAVEQMSKEDGLSLDELGTTAFEYTHPMLKELRRLGADVLPVLKLNLFLRTMRMQWHPQSGAGNQDRIEHTWQTNYYKTVSVLAESMFNDTNNKK